MIHAQQAEYLCRLIVFATIIIIKNRIHTFTSFTITTMWHSIFLRILRQNLFPFCAGICCQLEFRFDKMLPIHLHYRLTKSREFVCWHFTLKTTIKLTRKTKYKIKSTSVDVKLEFIDWFSVYLRGDLRQLRQCLPALIFSHMLGRSYSIYFSCLLNCFHEIQSPKFLHTSSLWQLLNKMPLLSCFS